MSQDEEQVDALNQQEDADLDTANEVQEETIEEVKAKLAKAEQIAENQRIRAEKAERLAKGEKPKVEPKAEAPKAGEYDLEDVAVLVSKVSAKEDREFVKRSAKLLGLSLEETLKDPIVIGKLKDFEEQRKTAIATSTSGSRRVSQKETADVIVEKANQGKLPTSDEDIAKLAAATVQNFKKK